MLEEVPQQNSFADHVAEQNEILEENPGGKVRDDIIYPLFDPVMTAIQIFGQDLLKVMLSIVLKVNKNDISDNQLVSLE